MSHRHKAIRTTTTCFTGPVSRKENPAAHGGVCYVDYCACGAERRTNVNQCFTETGAWTAMTNRQQTEEG